MIYKTLDHITRRDFDRADFDDWLRDQRRAVDEHNATVRAARLRAYNEMLLLASEAYGSTQSKQVKYLAKERIDEPPNLSRKFNQLLSAYHQHLEARRRIARNRELAQVRRQRNLEAHQTLQALGYVVGEDYYVSTAARFLAEVAGKPKTPDLYAVDLLSDT